LARRRPISDIEEEFHTRGVQTRLLLYRLAMFLQTKRCFKYFMLLFFLEEKAFKMKLTDNVVRNFLVAKIFRENTDRINSLDYSSNGETLISSSDDDSIIIYDCLNGL